MSSSPTDSHPNGVGGAAHLATLSAQAQLVDVAMPQMGVSVAEGTLSAWHKRVGDRVESDETICEISTDKVDTEIPSPAAGTVAELLVEVDETVAVGAVLARIAPDGAGVEAPPDAPSEPAHPDAAAPSDAVAPPAHAPEPPQTRPDPGPEPGLSAGEPGEGARRRYSPVVWRIARREGVDLAQVHGSGRAGRVRKQDVLAFIERRTDANGTDAAAAPRGAPGEAPAADRPMHIESPYREPQARDAAAGPVGGETQRLSRMRRTIAEHMVSSLHTAAHCTSIAEADMSRVQAARERLGITYLPFVARCAIDALRAHPDLNATLEGESLTRHGAVNLGIAVSLDREGLIVPVIRDAQDLSEEGLARAIADLARRARAGRLEPDEVHGGTFTITNPGVFGTLASTPIINQPQVAILDLEAVVRRPVVVADDAGREAIAIRSMAYLCLSWDHRALDGALAARFLRTLRERIESWGDA